MTRGAGSPAGPMRRGVFRISRGVAALAAMLGVAAPQLAEAQLFGRPQQEAAQQRQFTPEQLEILANIDAYFNSVRTLQGEFVQVGPNGEQSEGVFFMARPGKMRFQYSPPVRLDIIAGEGVVAIEDRTAMTQDFYPLSRTPLRHLLADRIDLTSAAIVREIRQEPDLISLVVADQSMGDGWLTLLFDSTTYELRQWIVTDAQGLNTSVAVFNTQAGAEIDPDYFKITRWPGEEENRG